MTNLVLITTYLFHIIVCISEKIECRNVTDCSGKDIICNSNSTDTDNICEIHCLLPGSCAQSKVYCASNKKCAIECSNSFSCDQMITHCPQTGNNQCDITATGNYALHNMNFNCYGSNCTVACVGVASCLNATFNSYHPHDTNSNLTIKCKDNIIDTGTTNEANFACKNIKIHCPKNNNGNKLCSVQAITENTENIAHSDLRIYAINSWDDIDLTQYKSILSGTSVMYCNDNYTNHCVMDNITNTNEWNCINKSSICYRDYSRDEEDQTNYPLIIGLSIGAFFCLIIALCIGLYLKKDEELFAEEYEKEQIIDSEIDALKSSQISVTEEMEEIDRDDTTDAFKQYKKMMQSIFYTFAGYTPWAKKTGLYMNIKELQTFLDIVNIDDPAEQVLTLIDTDQVDNRITLNEWMDYFVDKTINPHIFEIRHHIQSQITWELLVKAIKIFDITDKNHTGKLEYHEFQQFGIGIGLNDKETEILWHTMDTDNSGAIDIIELFEWFRLRLYQQRGRIAQTKQPSLICSKSDLLDLEDFRSNAKSIHMHKQSIQSIPEQKQQQNDDDETEQKDEY